ncbi:response regulator [Candidatus Bathyarchaeota archaeon]|nr:response regulator [Candidatus Bathyarchaeota archaeon]
MASVLIVDDAAFMRMILKKIVMNSGNQVVAEAANGDEAITLYKQYRPDIVLLDIVMPPGKETKDGIDTLRKIRSTDPNAKVIMCSSMGQQALITEALKLGAKDFIVKPFKPNKVMEVLAKYC